MSLLLFRLGSQDSNTHIRERKLEDTSSITLDSADSGDDNVLAWISRVVALVYIGGTSEDSQLGRSASSYTIEGERHWNGSSGVVDGSFEGVCARLAVLACDVVEWIEVACGWERLGEDVLGHERPHEPRSRADCLGWVGLELDHGDGPCPAVAIGEDWCLECVSFVYDVDGRRLEED